MAVAKEKPQITELDYLNKNFRYPTEALDPNSVFSRRPFFGQITGWFKKGLFKLTRQRAFANYFDAQEQFNMHMVRCMNDLSEAVNKKESRVDDNYQSAFLGLEKRLRKEVNSSLAEINQVISELRVKSDIQAENIESLDSVALGLERIVGSLSSTSPKGEVTQSESIDYSYTLLENRFRGSEDALKARLNIYLPILENLPGELLEVGAGRGELLELLQQEKISAYGVDLDKALVELAKSKGLDVRLENGLEHLAKLPSRSLGGVIATQVIEHLTPEQIKALCALSREKIKSGGKVVFETINTSSLVALSQNYFRDPTHVQPLHPDTTSYMMELSGLKVIEVKYLSPFKPEVLFQEIPVKDYMTPQWQATVETLNLNFSRLNELFFGYQDYAVIAEVI